MCDAHVSMSLPVHLLSTYLLRIYPPMEMQRLLPGDPRTGSCPSAQKHPRLEAPRRDPGCRRRAAGGSMEWARLKLCTRVWVYVCLCAA